MNLNHDITRGKNKKRGFKNKFFKVVTVQNGLGRQRFTPYNKGNDILDMSSSRSGRRTALNSTLYDGTDSKTVTTTTELNSRIILAITEGRGEATCEVGLAVIDIAKPTLILCQISDSQSYFKVLTKINVLDPTEILISVTMAESRLTQKIKEHFKNIKISGIPRYNFNKQTGLQYVRKLCAPAWNSIFLILQHKYYALTAASGLLSFIEEQLYVYYGSESIKVEYQESEGCTIIDFFTAEKLELVACAIPDSNKKYSSLFSILNNCETKLGARLLRASVLQPPCIQAEIEERLNCVQELVENQQKQATVKLILKKIPNIDQLLTLATLFPEQGGNPRQLQYLLILNSLLDLIEPLAEVFVDSEQEFYKNLIDMLTSEEMTELKDAVRDMISPNVRPTTGELGVVQRCFAVRHGKNELLDILRSKYNDLMEEMREHVAELEQEYGLHLQLANTSKKGYHILMQLSVYKRRTFNKAELPSIFLQVERTLKQVTMKTTKLQTLASRLEDVTVEIIKFSNTLISRLFNTIRTKVSILYNLCEDIAKLDMLQAFAQASSGAGRYVRPTFADITDVADSRHPILEYLSETEPAANNIQASKYYNMHLVCGPNGSGKSIYIRQIVLLQVMAQVGCYVPASQAIFRIADRILARIYLEDNMDLGASAFVLEVKEIQYFLSVLTPNTLIVIDELCRSTSINEGTALAMAICERFIQSSAFVFFTTHYNLITKLEDMYFNVKCWHLEVQELEVHGKNTLRYTHHVLEGAKCLEKFAIYLAKSAWPKETCEDAENFLKLLKIDKPITLNYTIDLKLKLKYKLETDLKIIKSLGLLTAEVVSEKLYNYQADLKKLGVDIDWDINDNDDDDDDDEALDEDKSQRVVENDVSRITVEDVRCLYPEIIYDTEATFQQNDNCSQNDPVDLVQNENNWLEYEDDQEEDVNSRNLFGEFNSQEGSIRDQNENIWLRLEDQNNDQDVMQNTMNQHKTWVENCNANEEEEEEDEEELDSNSNENVFAQQKENESFTIFRNERHPFFHQFNHDIQINFQNTTPNNVFDITSTTVSNLAESAKLSKVPSHNESIRTSKTSAQSRIKSILQKTAAKTINVFERTITTSNKAGSAPTSQVTKNKDKLSHNNNKPPQQQIINTTKRLTAQEELEISRVIEEIENSGCLDEDFECDMDDNVKKTEEKTDQTKKLNKSEKMKELRNVFDSSVFEDFDLTQSKKADSDIRKTKTNIEKSKKTQSLSNTNPILSENKNQQSSKSSNVENISSRNENNNEENVNRSNINDDCIPLKVYKMNHINSEGSISTVSSSILNKSFNTLRNNLQPNPNKDNINKDKEASSVENVVASNKIAESTVFLLPAALLKFAKQINRPPIDISNKMCRREEVTKRTEHTISELLNQENINKIIHSQKNTNDVDPITSTSLRLSLNPPPIENENLSKQKDKTQDIPTAPEKDADADQDDNTSNTNDNELFNNTTLILSKYQAAVDCDIKGESFSDDSISYSLNCTIVEETAQKGSPSNLKECEKDDSAKKSSSVNQSETNSSSNDIFTKNRVPTISKSSESEDDDDSSVDYSSYQNPVLNQSTDESVSMIMSKFESTHISTNRRSTAPDYSNYFSLKKGCKKMKLMPKRKIFELSIEDEAFDLPEMDDAKGKRKKSVFKAPYAGSISSSAKSTPTTKSTQSTTTKSTSSKSSKGIHKLTRKEIEDSYYEINKKLYNAVGKECETYSREILSRPSAKEIQSIEKLTTAYKNKDGSVIVRNIDLKKPKKQKKLKFQAPFKHVSDFDVKIFSDQNSHIFEQFISTGETSFSTSVLNNVLSAKAKTKLEKKPTKNIFL